MTGPERYRRLLDELLKAREAAGGTLPEEEESRRVAELDDVWHSLTAAEVDEVEAATDVI